MALICPFFILEKFTFATPTFFDNSFRLIFRSAITRSSLKTICPIVRPLTAFHQWWQTAQREEEKNRMISSFSQVHCNHHFDTRKRLHPLNTGDALPSIRALDQATLHFMDNCRVVFSFTKKEISTHQGQYLFLFFIIQLSGSRSFPLTSCAFSDLFLSRCSIASCFHTFPHLRLSEATQNPCPLCRLSSYRGTR